VPIIHIDGEDTDKRILRPHSCVDCVFFVDDVIPWCVLYRQRCDYNSKPQWCRVVAIIVTEERERRPHE
jgi:hypothetical protein